VEWKREIEEEGEGEKKKYWLAGYLQNLSIVEHAEYRQ
jgi:hypothetical protein